MKPRFFTLAVVALIGLYPRAIAQSNEQQKPNTFIVDVNFMTRGELRYGGLSTQANENDKDRARFVLARTRLGVGYSRKWLDLRVTAQHSGIWGEAGKGTISVYEAWARLKSNNGMFAQIGRQELNYDDERILGRNDWAMAANSHDAVRVGIERSDHKAHVILAYNQTSQNINGGTVYTTESGAYPHRSLIAAWYHYDAPKVPVSASLLFTNIGMQNPNEENPKVRFQQLIGGYANFHPHKWNVEASYYHQMGHDEFNTPISAWMASVKADFTPVEQWTITAGYDYLSGDDNPIVPAIGQIGLTKHTKVKGFSTVYGSHHKFYGAMDFFYVSAYYGGYTPGLQNLFSEVTCRPVKNLSLKAGYHYLLTASNINNAGRTLGHELEITTGYNVLKDVKISAGYTYMSGSPTLEQLHRVKGKNHLHWGWLMLSVNPSIFHIKW